MAASMRPSQPMPLFVIDTCPSDDNEEVRKPAKASSNARMTRAWSLPNCHETYKDLHGAVHYSLLNHFQSFLNRSRSYPNPNLSSIYSKVNDKYFQLQSPSASVHMNMNSLDPHAGGSQTPGGASSRYSHYGSFFDVSESGYYPSSEQHCHRSDNKLLTIGGRPLLIVDQNTRLTNNTFQDKCQRLASSTTDKSQLNLSRFFFFSNDGSRVDKEIRKSRV